MIVFACKSNKAACPQIEVEHTVSLNDLTTQKQDLLADKRCNVQLFKVGVQTSGGIPDKISDWEVTKTDFRDQLECTSSALS